MKTKEEVIAERRAAYHGLTYEESMVIYLRQKAELDDMEALGIEVSDEQALAWVGAVDSRAKPSEVAS